jgi:DNA-binding CsgD family transcriptional regulator
MWFRPETQVFYLGYVLLGAAAGAATTSYSYIYIYGFTHESRIKYTALYLCALYSTSMILGYAASLMGDNGAFLLITLMPVSVFLLNQKFTVESMVSPDSIPKRPFPKKLMLLMGAVIFLAYFNAGIEANIYNMGENIINTVSDNITQAIALLSIFFLSGRIDKFFLVYCGFIVKGISYVLYIIAGGPNSLTSYLVILSITAIELFNFCMIGDIALKYGNSYGVFRMSLIMGAAGAIVGEVSGSAVVSALKLDNMIVVGIALIILLISLIVMPLLQKYVGIYENLKVESTETVMNSNSFDDVIEKLKHLNNRLPKGRCLTPRELEIAVFLIERLDYATITKRLYITENTLKSHVTHIYHKFDVSGRKELSEYLQSMIDSETDTNYEIN